MKKLLSILLACGLLCALAACSGNGKVSISIEEETGSIPPSVAPQNTETPEQTQPEATTLELDTLYEIPDYAELTLVRITTTSEVWASMGGTLYYENKKDGEIYIDNKCVNNVNVNKRNIGMVFQSYALFPHMTVEQNIAYGLEQRKLSKAEIGQRVQDIIRLVKLEGLEKRKPKQLSGGHGGILLMKLPYCGGDAERYVHNSAER